MHRSAKSKILDLLPASLTTLRLFLAPLLLILVVLGAPRFIFIILIAAAFLSDWLDGVIARRRKIATPFLRRYDIAADLIFYLAVFLSVCYLEQALVVSYRGQFVLLLVLEILCQVTHWMRFQAMTATHSYLCKLWGVFLPVTAIAILGFGIAEPFLRITFILGYIAYADVLLIILVARRVPIDVISAYHVWRSDEKLRETA